MRLTHKAKQFIFIVLLAIVMVGYCLVGDADFYDAIQTQARYCEGVREGWHGDYKPEIECE